MICPVIAGFPNYSEDSCDLIFLIDWVQEEIISRWTVPHSTHLKAAVQYKSSDTDELDFEGLDFDEDDGQNIAKINTKLEVVSREEFYILHSEVLMPELEEFNEFQDWGQYIRVWKVSGKESKLVFSKRNIRLVSFSRNLLIYEEVTSESLPQSENPSEFGTTLVNFQDADKIVHWLNLDTNTDCHSQVFCSEFIPLHTSAVMEDGTLRVVQVFFEGSSCEPDVEYQDRIIIFDIDMKAPMQTGRVLQFPKLLHGNEIGDNFDLELLGDGKLYFAHQVFGWSNGTLHRGVLPLCKRMLVVEEGAEKPNIEIWNCQDTHTHSQVTGCYPYVFSDFIMR